MCDMCDGQSLDAHLDDVRDRIRRGGWALQGVEPGAEGHGWTYTVGLLASYDHPELVVVDDDLRRGGSLLDAMARAIRDGAVIEPGDRIDLDGARAEVVDVHPDHLAGDLLVTCRRLLGPGGGPDDLEAHQVVVHGDLPGGGRLPDIRLDRPVPGPPDRGSHLSARDVAARRWAR